MKEEKSKFTPPPLKPHQLVGADFLLANNFALLADEMGVGKSATVVHASRFMKNILVVCPATAKVNWRREFLKFANRESYIVGGKKKEQPKESNIIITNYERISRSPEKYKKIKWDAIVFDECFVAGTKISTPKGEICIEDVIPGDVVYSAAGEDVVVATRKSTSMQTIKINNTECTFNHKFFTSRGWVTAENLKIGDELVGYKEAMRMVQDGLFCSSKQDKVLRSLLLREISNDFAGSERKSVFQRSYTKRSEEAYWSEEPFCFGMAQKEQLHVQTRSKEESIGYFKKDRAQTFCSQRERQWTNETRTDNNGNFRSFMDKRISGCTVQALLQNRYCSSKKNDRNRSGRNFAPIFKSEKSGQKERKRFERIRVESIQVQEQRSRITYNLQVKKHPSYSANGALVHNCHFVKEPGAQRTQALFGVNGVIHNTHKVWCLSGTPAPNHAGELWVLMYTFGKTKFGYEGFIQRYCNTSPVANKYAARTIRGTNTLFSHELRETLSKFSLRRLLIDVVKDMPEISYNTVVVESNENPLKDHPELMKKVKEEWRILSERIGMMTWPADEEKLLNLLTLLSESISSLRRYHGLKKAAVVADIISQELTDNAYKKIIIFGIHNDVLEIVRERLQKFNPAMITGKTPQGRRQHEIDRFQNDETCHIFIGNIHAAGTALTLTASNRVDFIELDYVPGNNQQAAGRARRLGQKLPVLSRFFSLSGFDERVSEIIRRKTQEISTFIT